VPPYKCDLIFKAGVRQAPPIHGKTDEMKLTIERQTKIIFGVFLATTFTIFMVHLVWVWPGQRCEEAGKWWDWRTRACAQPIMISSITGRILKSDAARDAARAELAKLKAATPPK